eukprot:s717_g4.t1
MLVVAGRQVEVALGCRSEVVGKIGNCTTGFTRGSPGVHILRVHHFAPNLLASAMAPLKSSGTTCRCESPEKQNALNEVRLLASVCHENVVAYKEAFWDDKTRCLCIVQECADEKIAVDKTFGLKNKNKSKVVQKYIKSITNNASGAPKGGKEQQERDAKEAKQKELQKAALMNSLFNMSTDKKGRAFDPVAKKKAKQAEEEALAAGKKLKDEEKKDIIEGVANTIRLTNPKTGIRMSEIGGHPIIQALKTKHADAFKILQLLLFIKANDKVFWVDDPESTNPTIRCLEDVEAEVAPDSRPIEEIIEERRAALPPGGTPVTLETFKAWKDTARVAHVGRGSQRFMTAIAADTAGPHLPAPDPSGHCRTSFASSAGLHLPAPDPSGHCRTSSASSAGLHLPAPDRSGHCRTSTASSRSQWALPDFNREEEKREAERLERVEQERLENAKKTGGTKGLIGMSGRDLFTYDAWRFTRLPYPDEENDGKTKGVASELQDDGADAEDAEDDEAAADPAARGSNEDAAAINEKLFLQEEELPDDLDDGDDEED